MTTTDQRPNAPLPADTHILCDWADADNEYRIISTFSRLIDSESRVLVSATAVQLPDGSIHDGDDEHEVPEVFIDELEDDGYSCTRLTITRHSARKLAAALIETAALLDGWVAK